jgi:hypothetical protein
VQCLAALCFGALLAVSLWGGETPPAPAAPPPTLAELEARVPKDFKDQDMIRNFVGDVVTLAGSNTLNSGEEFYRLAQLAVWGVQEYRVARVRYELLLAATAKGQAGADKELQAAWDILLRLLGRPMRTDTGGYVRLNPGSFDLEPAPECIAVVWRDPAAARTAAAATQDNLEVQAIVDADQAARKNWSNWTPEEMKAIMAADTARNVRMREIIQAGDLHTARDFSNSSLVMQHSARFSGYQLAHELAVSSLLLGDRSRGRWLVTATYDRMLRSVGHDQRFGTQKTMKGPPLRVDEEGISDAQRQALGCPTLAQARAPRPAAPVDLGNKLRGAEGLVRDEEYGVSVTLPANWTLDRAGQAGEQARSLFFDVRGQTEVKANLYYRISQSPLPEPTGSYEAALRDDAQKKAADRINLYPGYANRADSFVYRTVNGYPALSWTADYTDNGRKYSEYLTRVRGPSGIALFFMTAPAETIGAVRPDFDRLIETIHLP